MISAMQHTKRLLALVPVCLLAACATTENPPPEEGAPMPAAKAATAEHAAEPGTEPAPASEAEATGEAPAGKTAATGGCDGLADQLQEIAAAADPAAAAAEAKLDLVEGRVRLAIELDGPAPDLGAAVTVEVTTDTLLQVLAPPADLCRLGALPGVKTVRAPLKPNMRPPKGPQKQSITK